MFTNAGEVLKFIGDQKVEFVDVRFCDLPGTVQHFTVPVENFDEKIFSEGLMFDGSSIRGFQQIHESDMLLMPDPTTAMLDPFRQHTTLDITFFVHDPLTGEPYSRDPRNIARKAQDFLRGTGIADTVYFGPEAEFYIFDSARFATGANEGYYHLDSIEGAWNTGRDEDGGNLGYKPRYKGGYFPVPPMDHLTDLRSEMVRMLIRCGIGVEMQHHEVGTAGQAEIDIRFAPLLHMADNMMNYKYIVKSVARAAGKTVTFMPKPLFGDNGSGMHCHQSLWKDDAPLFYDEVGYAGLSDIGRYYVGGLLKHAPSLLAFTNPTVNSYHRLVPQGQAAGIPGARPVVQPVPGVLGDAHGRDRRHPQQDRATGADRQGPVRAAAGRGAFDPAGSRLAGQGAGHAGSGSRLPGRRRGVHPGPDRDLAGLQADQ
jgi:glutamine synthetase